VVEPQGSGATRPLHCYRLYRSPETVPAAGFCLGMGMLSIQGSCQQDHVIAWNQHRTPDAMVAHPLAIGLGCGQC